jgi:hypothetical protein
VRKTVVFFNPKNLQNQFSGSAFDWLLGAGSRSIKSANSERKYGSSLKVTLVGESIFEKKTLG